MDGWWINGWVDDRLWMDGYMNMPMVRHIYMCVYIMIIILYLFISSVFVHFVDQLIKDGTIILQSGSQSLAPPSSTVR